MRRDVLFRLAGFSLDHQFVPRNCCRVYIPPHFRVENREVLIEFINRHSFATLVTFDGNAPYATHIPVLHRKGSGENGVLVAHVARANPQWQHFKNGTEALVIFQGPHAYISPSWYETELVVPTWNYAAVHVYGAPSILSDQQDVLNLLDETVRTFETGMEKPWDRKLPDEFRARMAQAVVGFEIPISRLEGKFKLSQNRPEADIRGAHRALSASRDPQDNALAELMLRHSNSAAAS